MIGKYAELKKYAFQKIQGRLKPLKSTWPTSLSFPDDYIINILMILNIIKNKQIKNNNTSLDFVYFHFENFIIDNSHY